MADKNDFHIMLISIILILIVILLITVPIIKNKFFPKEEKLPTMTYNGFEFTKKGDILWYTQYERNKQLYNLQFHFNPKEVEGIPLSGELYENFSDTGIVYIAFDPDEGPDLRYVTVTAGELGLNLANAMNYELIAACTRNETAGCKDQPIVTCDDSDKSVIYLKMEQESSIEFKGNCIVVKGNQTGLLKSADNLLYRWYKIIK